MHYQIINFLLFSTAPQDIYSSTKLALRTSLLYFLLDLLIDLWLLLSCSFYSYHPSNYRNRQTYKEVKYYNFCYCKVGRAIRILFNPISRFFKMNIPNNRMLKVGIEYRYRIHPREFNLYPFLIQIYIYLNKRDFIIEKQSS